MLKNLLRRIFLSDRFIHLKFYISRNGDGSFTCFSTHDTSFRIMSDPASVYRFVNDVMQSRFYIDLFDYACLFSRNDPLEQLIDAMEMRKDFEKKLRFDCRTIIELGIYFK